MRKMREQHPNSKLTSSSVKAMRRMYWCNHIMQKDLALMFEISQATVSEIVNYKYWVTVPDDFRPEEVTRQEQ